MLSFLLKCAIKDVCTDALGLSPLHPQCFASSAGAVLGMFWILCSTDRRPEQPRSSRSSI